MTTKNDNAPEQRQRAKNVLEQFARDAVPAPNQIVAAVWGAEFVRCINMLANEAGAKTGDTPAEQIRKWGLEALTSAEELARVATVSMLEASMRRTVAADGDAQAEKPDAKLGCKRVSMPVGVADVVLLGAIYNAVPSTSFLRVGLRAAAARLHSLHLIEHDPTRSKWYGWRITSLGEQVLERLAGMLVHATLQEVCSQEKSDEG